ncbi:hypothetical protein OIDMADRAFT_102431 [Oidiodendron maius Zn]|uniref:Myb-like domain-containing protein n=1 Tax=Oidiodendron maius (strain Zn) TaxID=913774 RepID=A0A0C3HM87_OIDMZ|nr:hypothetical protein OIDMADRAFT_102431 [Oidiodendron maius Zn]
MLLPSAFTCETTSAAAAAAAATHPPKTLTRYQSALFASPPLSPPPSSSSSTHPAISNLYSTCRALQSMLTPPSQLPSPPTTHAEVATLSSPFKLRLRQRAAGGSAPAPRKITKRIPAAPPRGINKRRRALADDLSRENVASPTGDGDEAGDDMPRPSTPKRVRVAPEVLPLGLYRADFQSLAPAPPTAATDAQLLPAPEIASSSGTADGANPEAKQTEPQSEGRAEGRGEEEWSTEQDRILVELVLEKLKLTKSDWQDCARSLGKDRGSVGRRWKSLMGAGEIGLKGRGRLRRGKIHGTWR